MIQRNRIGIVSLVSALCALTAFVAAPRAQAQDGEVTGSSSVGHIATRGFGTGMFGFSCFFNFPGQPNAFQLVQGQFNVSGSLTADDIQGYEKNVDGSVTAHIVTDGYLNGLTAYPVTISLDVKMVNGSYKVGTTRWKVTTQPDAVFQRTWMDSSRILGTIDSYLYGYWRTDILAQ